MADLPIGEFLDLGLLHEINRRFFHPIAMELRVRYDHETETYELDGIEDYRATHPEGLVFGSGHEPAKPEAADQYDRLLRATARQIKYGYVIQPVAPLEPTVVDSITPGKPMPREIKGSG